MVQEPGNNYRKHVYDTRIGDIMSEDFILHVNSCYTPTEQIHNASILFKQGQIMAVGGFSALEVLADAKCISMPNCHALPGLVDTHLHGSGGFDVMDISNNDEMNVMSLALARHGVTSFVPTILAAPKQKMMMAAAELSKHCFNENLPGAIPVGIHMEGPYLSLKKRGAQTAEDLQAIDLKVTEDLIRSANGKLKVMTFAPELNDSEKLAELLCEHNVVPSMGHSLAAADDTLRAVAAGASRCTHFFNGMPPLDQRHVALTSLGLTDDRITIELIVDGIHVSPEMIDLACRSKPVANIVSVSDATQGAGLVDGIYHLGKDQIIIADGASRRVSDGKLAGSCMTLDRGLKNLIQFSNLGEVNSLCAHTINAARSIGLKDRGVIKPGKRGDIVVVDENWEVQMTIVNGKIVYDRQKESESRS